MTRKVYKSAMGRTVDLGALLLQNEQVRAVGNMGVNAAGDLIDGSNKVIDQRNRQVQRQYKKQSNVSSTPIATSNLSARQSRMPAQESIDPILDEALETIDQPTIVSAETKTDEEIKAPASGGLAAAIARNREIKQELEKTLRERKQEQGVKKI